VAASANANVLSATQDSRFRDTNDLRDISFFLASVTTAADGIGVLLLFNDRWRPPWLPVEHASEHSPKAVVFSAAFDVAVTGHEAPSAGSSH
jgi:hypothetical protein